MIQTLFQIITEGRCGEHRLPKKTAIVLAGNLGEEDDTTITEFDDAALDGRLATFHLKPVAAHWLSWAMEHAIHPAILRYVSLFPERLWDEHRIHPNPRGWHQASRSLWHAWKLEDEAALKAHLASHPNSPLEKTLNALVGDLAAWDFIREMTSPRTLSTADILSGDHEAMASIREGKVPTEDLLWALHGAIGMLTIERRENGGRLTTELEARLLNILTVIALSRADSRMAFCHQLIRESGLLLPIPKALETADPATRSTIMDSLNQLLAG